jgi:hypothetical protein
MKEIKAHAHKVHKARHDHLGMQSTTHHPGYASGGAEHPHKGHSAADERADTALIHNLVKPSSLNRASGGRAHKGKKGGTHVNIMVGRPGGDAGPGAGPMPMPPPGAAGPMPMPMPPAAMAGRGPMPPMGAGGPPPGGIGGAPVLPPRKHGGRAKSR